MSLLKALFKLSVVAILAVAAIGLVFMFQRGGSGSDASHQTWPDVPRNPSN